MSSHVTDQYLAQFDPYRDSTEWVVEEPDAYVRRMQSTVLPNWPSEPLTEWLFRHAGHIRDYAFLQFENFTFGLEFWNLSDIPEREVFADPTFFDDFVDIRSRAKGSTDWLAQYMMEHGTWNTPVVLLSTPHTGMVGEGGWPIRHPWHLLEGHRRLSFLGGLRRLGIAKPLHSIWVVRVPPVSKPQPNITMESDA